jgi:pre-mRNA-processing factor 40
LPYGDERPAGSRRRRADSDVESAGSIRVAKVRRSCFNDLTWF